MLPSTPDGNCLGQAVNNEEPIGKLISRRLNDLRKQLATVEAGNQHNKQNLSSRLKKKMRQLQVRIARTESNLNGHEASKLLWKFGRKESQTLRKMKRSRVCKRIVLGSKCYLESSILAL